MSRQVWDLGFRAAAIGWARWAMAPPIF